MPKVRPIEYSFIDVQKHLSVGRSRISKVPNSPNNIKAHTNLIGKIDECMRLTQEIIKEVITLNENNNLSQSLANVANRAITNELNLIEKEAKKNIPKIDYSSAIRAMCNVNDVKEAYKIGREHNMPQEEMDQVVKKAPIHTNLGMAYAAILNKQKPIVKVVPVVPAVIPDTLEEDENLDDNVTNDSDIPDELKALLK
jgi:hypothetical protein